MIRLFPKSVILVTAVTVLLVACVAGRSKRRPATDIMQEGFEQYRTASQQFDRYLSKQMPQAEESSYLENCKRQPDHSPFCFSVNQRDLLDERAKKLRPTKTRHARAQRVVPNYRRGKWTNWLDLRYSSVSSLLRGLRNLPREQRELLRERVLTEEKCPNNIAIALAASMEDLLPNQSTYSDVADLYQKGGECLSSDAEEMVAITTRAGALYFAGKNFIKAKQSLEFANTVKEAFRARTLYWLHQTQKELGEKAQAEASLKELKTAYPFSFHGIMAQIAAGDDPGEVLERSSTESLTRSTQLPQLNRLIEQVEILHRFGFTKAAEKVLTWTVAESPGVEPEVMIYLSDLQESQGNYVGKISILSDVLYQSPELISKSVMEKYFPKVYFPLFEKHSNGLDPYLLMALTRRESAFNARAISRTRAKGLMQLMPGTLRGLSFDKNLFDPDANVFVGSRYLSDLLGRVNGQIHLALAAYNAGPNRVEEWVTRYPMVDPVLFSDLIPFRETRDYVAAVIRNYYWYRRIHQNDTGIQTNQLLQLSSNSALDKVSEAAKKRE